MGSADQSRALPRVHGLYAEAMRMPVELTVDAERWRRGLRTMVEATPGIVPVIKGNGYGFGRDLLAGEAHDLGLSMVAVGTYAEVPDALAAFDGDVMVMTP